MNFVLRAFAADNDDGDVDDDGDDEGHVEALVAHLWNLLCPSTLPKCPWQGQVSPHEHQHWTQQCFRQRYQVQAQCARHINTSDAHSPQLNGTNS